MALHLKDDRKRNRSTYEYWLLNDLQKIEAVVIGNCFDALNFLQRKATLIAVKLAARVVSGVSANIELHEDGWRIGPDCTDSPPPAAKHQSQLLERVQKSFKRDYDSQKARVALRPRLGPDALDKYFEPEADDASEFSPALVRYRERSQFQLTGV